MKRKETRKTIMSLIAITAMATSAQAVIDCAVVPGSSGVELREYVQHCGPQGATRADQISDISLSGDILTFTETAASGDAENVQSVDLSSLAGADGADGADGATGPAGADGTDGTDGATGPAGADGTDGADGADGATGPTGADGTDGAIGPAGADGTDGVDGTNGTDGTDGAAGTGETGAAGAAGKDGDKGDKGDKGDDGEAFNFDKYTEELINYQAALLEYQIKLDDVADYTADSAAGNMATAAIDFGTVGEGQTEVGFGLGYSSGDYGYGSVSSVAGGLGIKYGLTEEEALIAKGWFGSNGAYAVGGAITHRY